MLDFKELPKDGEAFEQLVRELLFSYGMDVEWSGRGPDGGRDLMCREPLRSLIAPASRTWLVQCKHFAHADRSVGADDLNNVVDSCTQHKATGYLLVCSTQPSSAAVSRLEGITVNSTNTIVATFWDSVTVERLLSKPVQWAIAQRFFPVSAGNWRLYATERPNNFVAHYRGYVFHLTNRIGSVPDHHLPSLEKRIAEIEHISSNLPDGEFMRPRAVWYDDKNGGYNWYIDFMYPNDKQPSISGAQLARELRDGWVLEDGQWLHWDIEFVQYWPHSDHYDRDHYEYYVRYMPNFLAGADRAEKDWHRKYATAEEIEKIEKEAREKRHVVFNGMIKSFDKVEFLTVVRGVNAGIEAVHRFERRYVWSDIMESLGESTDASHLFDALIIMNVKDEGRFHELLSLLPNDEGCHFRVSRVYMYLPEQGLVDEDEPHLFDLKLSIHPRLMSDQVSARKAFDNYFDEIRRVVEEFAQRS